MKSHPTKQMRHDKSPFLVVEKKESINTSAEVTMSDIAKKLRSVYTHMQMKKPSSHLTSQRFVQENLKAYLDDISRAILAEHYQRRQKEKKLFEHLEQIKALIQKLQSEKKGLEKAKVTQNVARSKSLDSVVQRLAHMTGEEEQKHFSLQKEKNFSKQNSVNTLLHNVKNMSQKKDESSLPTDAIKLSSEEVLKSLESSVTNVENSVIEKRHSDIPACDRSSSLNAKFLNAKPQRKGTLLRYFVKKFFTCFLIIAFMAAIALCFYGFLRGVRFFNF